MAAIECGDFLLAYLVLPYLQITLTTGIKKLEVVISIVFARKPEIF